MNKEYYNNCLKQYIRELMEIEENYINEIGEIASFVETHDIEKDNCNLSRLDILAINEKRGNIVAIGELIHNLDKLIIKD